MENILASALNKNSTALINLVERYATECGMTQEQAETMANLARLIQKRSSDESFNNVLHSMKNHTQRLGCVEEIVFGSDTTNPYTNAYTDAKI